MIWFGIYLAIDLIFVIWMATSKNPKTKQYGFAEWVFIFFLAPYFLLDLLYEYLIYLAGKSKW